MKRYRGFILSEQLLTIMLQASFILVLYMSFYQITTFYAQTQQIMTARNHAERVISFMDDKIRHAGLGLWRCKDSADIRNMLGGVGILGNFYHGGIERGYRWPVALQRNEDSAGNPDGTFSGVPAKLSKQDSGDMLTLLYARSSFSTGEGETISAFKNTVKLNWNGITLTNESNLSQLLDSANNVRKSTLFSSGSTENIKSYVVMEGVGLPMYLVSIPNNGGVKIAVRGDDLSRFDGVEIPAGGELLGLRAMQMFVHGEGDSRQFAFRELDPNGRKWDKINNQEAGILDIYMERVNNTFTVWVLGTGGYDVEAANPRPDSWPKEANPAGEGATEAAKEADAKAKWLASDYCHHTVYVSRATWKLNNIPSGFNWK